MNVTVGPEDATEAITDDVQLYDYALFPEDIAALSAPDEIKGNSPLEGGLGGVPLISAESPLEGGQGGVLPGSAGVSPAEESLTPVSDDGPTFGLLGNGIPVGVKYYYLNGQRVAQSRDGVFTWIHADHLSSATRITDAAGLEVRRLAYKSFGEEAENQGSGDDPKYTYTGKEADNTGLYYYGARYYDPALSRFTTADTVYDAGPQGLNRYSYALNNPIIYRDPTGHSTGVDPETGRIDPPVGREETVTIVIDPGHGVNKHKITKTGDQKELGFDTGARKPPHSQNPISTEHELALDLAKALKPGLERFGHRVVLTRERPLDVDPSLEEIEWRFKIVNREKADYVISIHLDSFASTAKNRVLVYYLDTKNEGKTLAKHITTSVTNKEFERCEPVPSKRGVSKKKEATTHPDDYEKGTLRMVWKHNAVGVLIEAGNLQDPQTEAIITGGEFINQVVQGMQNGITEIENSRNP